MAEHWDIKVIADSIETAQLVLDQVCQATGLLPKGLEIIKYEKFPRMWSCVFEHTHSGDSDSTHACKQRFSDLTRQSWDHEWTETIASDARRQWTCYEAIADVRNGPMTVQDVFWVHLYAETKGPKPTVDA